MPKSMILATAVLVAAFPTVSHAQQQSISVFYGDLNLTADAGVRGLERRLDKAIKIVCQQDNNRLTLFESLLVRQCTEESWADIADSKQAVIDRARQRPPIVEVASAGGAKTQALTVRRH